MDSRHSISPYYSPAFQLFQLHLSERIFHCDYPGSFSPSLQLKTFPTPWCMAYRRDGQTCRCCVQGSAGIASTLFKEEAEQSQCPTPLPTDLPDTEQYSRKAGSTPKNVERNVFEGNLFNWMFQARRICLFLYCKICLPGSKAIELLHRLSRATRHSFLYPELMEEFHFSHKRKM